MLAPIRPTVLAAAALAALSLVACAPRTEEGRSQTVEGLRFDYGLTADAAANQPPASHPDPAMHGGPPARANAYHIVLSVADATTGRKVDATDVESGIGGPGHVGLGLTPMEPMMVNGQASWGHYVVLPEPGRYLLEFHVRRAGDATPVKARFAFDRPQ